MDTFSAPTVSDHGGNLDAACRKYGGTRADWLDLSTGINPNPYDIGAVDAHAWHALPDQNAFATLEAAARQFWNVPDDMAVLIAPGCSSVIAQIPTLFAPGYVAIPGPTYNEHEAAFRFHGWTIAGDASDASVIVHPNNPTGMYHGPIPQTAVRIIDESFCDVDPGQSKIADVPTKGTLILKSFGKFWGLAGLRLGFAIGDPQLIAALRKRLGPWAVSGPALAIGTRALQDMKWADETRLSLFDAAQRLDTLLLAHVDQVLGHVPLFRTYVTEDAQELHQRLARHHIWTRVFPYNASWVRIGLPPNEGWKRLEAALS